jgi:UPF0271 protein|tara:strand:+ start:537 stop:1310 length:774 start_codon:yes stop_codon:yes gene_type:complete
MEININCDLGENSKFCSTENDPMLLSIVNSANVACGYHAGDKVTMKKTVETSKKNGVSIGAHPSFNDPENFGRKRLNLQPEEINKLIVDQINILSEIARKNSMKVTHVKPHGALNNMACEDFELARIIAKSIISADKDLIFLVPTGSEMEKAGKKLDMKVAAEIFADRNYEDDGNLISRSKSNALITDPEIAKNHVVKMVKNQTINCFSGKQIPCEIDSICVHGDGKSAVSTARKIKEGLLENGVELKTLVQLKKFI